MAPTHMQMVIGLYEKMESPLDIPRRILRAVCLLPPEEYLGLTLKNDLTEAAGNAIIAYLEGH